jgi:serine protease
VEQRLETTARDLGPPGFDPRYGHGLVDGAAVLR